MLIQFFALLLSCLALMLVTRRSRALMKVVAICFAPLLFISTFAQALDTRMSNAAALAACNAVVDLVDAGAGAGVLRIYTGTPPTDVDAAETGTLLAELTMSDPAFGNCADDAPGATATAGAIAADPSANATGTAGYFRVDDSNGNAVLQGDVSATGGGGDLQLNSTSISSGVTVSVSSYTYTQPEN